MTSVLVTGAAGLVGREVVRQFELAGISSTGVWRNVPSCDASENVQWDIAGEAPPQALRRHWDVVVNAAASTRWSMTKEEAFRANVATVKSLAEVCAPDTHVVHVSTAYAGGRSGAATDFRNNYEWSKAESERVADLSFSRLSIVRPSLIVGRREDGFAAKFTGMYLLVRGIVTGTIPVIVGSPTAYFDVVPVDDLAREIVAIALARGPGGDMTTVAGGKSALSLEAAVEAIMASMNRWRSAAGCEPLAAPRILDEEQWARFFLPFARNQLSPRHMAILDSLSHFRPYLEIDAALVPEREIANPEEAIDRSVEYWASRHRRVAGLTPKSWTI